MLLPVGDDNRDRRIFPVINYLLIILNLFVFIYFQGCGSDIRFTYTYSLVPAEILSGEDSVTEPTTVTDPLTGIRYTLPGLQPTPFSVYITMITSIFMHGGLAHIIGNMLFLFIFGDNIENKLGHFRYLLFYLLCGIAASLAHVYVSVLIGSNLLIPLLGASGAISGVLGGYLLLFPGRRVRVLLFYIFTDVPAVVAIGFWFIFQVIEGMGMLASGTDGGIAYGAHIGGFIIGLITIKFFIKYKWT